MHLDISKLGEVVDTYDTMEEKWDDRLAQLELELDAISEEIRDEKNHLQAKASSNLNMRTRVAIQLVATAGEVEIDISYGTFAHFVSFSYIYLIHNHSRLSRMLEGGV